MMEIGDYEIVNDDDSQNPMMAVSVSTLPGEMSFPIDLSQEGYATIEGFSRHRGDRISVIKKGDEELLLYSGYYLKKK